MRTERRCQLTKHGLTLQAILGTLTILLGYAQTEAAIRNPLQRGKSALALTQQIDRALRAWQLYRRRITLLVLLVCASHTFGQVTPNLNFNIPTPGTQSNTWGPLLNANFASLDSLLSGITAIPGLNISGNLTLSGLTGTKCLQENSGVVGVASAPCSTTGNPYYGIPISSYGTSDFCVSWQAAKTANPLAILDGRGFNQSAVTGPITCSTSGYVSAFYGVTYLPIGTIYAQVPILLQTHSDVLGVNEDATIIKACTGQSYCGSVTFPSNEPMVAWSDNGTDWNYTANPTFDTRLKNVTLDGSSISGIILLANCVAQENESGPEQVSGHGWGNGGIGYLWGCANLNTAATYPNLDDQTLPGNWLTCGLSCAGGTGSATGITLTNGVTSPSLDGHSMELAFTAPTVGGGDTTNVLAYNKVGANNALTYFQGNWSGYIPSLTNVQALEFDQFHFAGSPNVRYMMGSQCVIGGVWDIWNQLTSSWVATTVPCTWTAATWHSVQWNTHHDALGVNLCNSNTDPCMYYDKLTVDGTPHTSFTAQPTTTSSDTNNVGIQFQVDANSSGGAITYYIDELNYSVSTTSTIGSGSNGPGSQNHKVRGVDFYLMSGETSTASALCILGNTGVIGEAGPKQLENVTCTVNSGFVGTKPNVLIDIKDGTGTHINAAHMEGAGQYAMELGDGAGVKGIVGSNINGGNLTGATALVYLSSAANSSSIVLNDTDTVGPDFPTYVIDDQLTGCLIPAATESATATYSIGAPGSIVGGLSRISSSGVAGCQTIQEYLTYHLDDPFHCYTYNTGGTEQCTNGSLTNPSSGQAYILTAFPPSATSITVIDNAIGPKTAPSIEPAPWAGTSAYLNIGCISTATFNPYTNGLAIGTITPYVAGTQLGELTATLNTAYVSGPVCVLITLKGFDQ